MVNIFFFHQACTTVGHYASLPKCCNWENIPFTGKPSKCATFGSIWGLPNSVPGAVILRITFTIQAYCISLFIVYVSFPSTCQDMYHFRLFLRLVSFSISAQMKSFSISCSPLVVNLLKLHFIHYIFQIKAFHLEGWMAIPCIILEYSWKPIINIENHMIIN